MVLIYYRGPRFTARSWHGDAFISISRMSDQPDQRTVRKLQLLSITAHRGCSNWVLLPSANILTCACESPARASPRCPKAHSTRTWTAQLSGCYWEKTTSSRALNWWDQLCNYYLEYKWLSGSNMYCFFGWASKFCAYLESNTWQNISFKYLFENNVTLVKIFLWGATWVIKNLCVAPISCRYNTIF